ncbi:hypothetical protein [Hyphococcus sp.]|uniref:hypothetical protein n=1 Tax=Hyphococcus sp. TaxID=2038636 RepID=UPI00208C5C27|nr:MAG: hypothetical protein DHS20C04_02890 [Marinicaulis sp.]
MTRKLFRFGAIALIIAAAAGCGESGPKRTLLDAAGLYSENKATFQTIRAAYPGPFEDFARIPARDPADDDGLDREFLKILREQFPVERIDFFPIGTTGDEIDVVIDRYQDGDHWVTVSLVYFSTPLTLSKRDPKVRLFKSCDQNAVDWLNGKSEAGALIAFCQLDASWYAYQKVE